MDFCTVLDGYCPSRSGNPEHCIYIVTGDDVVRWRKQGLLRVWKRNRKFDQVRMKEIRQHQDERDHVNGTLHFAQLPGQGLVCYDGGHRFRAVTDQISVVILDVMWNATEDDVRDQFNAINSAQLVPQILKEDLEDTALANYKKIEEYVDSVCKAYPKLVATKERTTRPGFLRSDLIDDINKRYNFFQKNGQHTLDELLKAIDYLNYAISEGQYDHVIDIKPNSYKRAKVGGFFLYTTKEPLDRGDLAWALGELKK